MLPARWKKAERTWPGDVAEGAVGVGVAEGGRFPEGRVGQIVGAPKPEVGEVMAVVGVQVVDLGEAQLRPHGPDLALEQAEGGIVELHVRRLGHHPGVGGGPGHAVHVLGDEGHRLLDEQVAAGLQDGEGGAHLGVGLAQEDGVEIGGQQVAQVREPGGDAVLLGGGARQRRRQVAEAGDLELLAQEGEVGQVLHLGHGAAADDADPQPAGLAHPVFPARGASRFHWSAVSWSLSTTSRRASHIASR